MNNLKIFSIIFMILQVFIIKNVNAQDVLDKIPPSPDIAAFGKFIDVPVSYYTGIPEITIPIHTLTEGSLSLPISLDYHAGGIKVNEVASRVGLGWALNAGGFIARTVQGLPDESENGYFNVGSLINMSCGNHLIPSIANGTLDGEPDIFSFMIPGYSGKFYFNADGEVVQIVHSDLKIETNLNLNPFNNGFKITTPKGTTYYFGAFEGNSHLSTENYTAIYGDFHSAWSLVKIESYNGTENIIIDYNYENLNFNTKANWNCLEDKKDHFRARYNSPSIKSIKTDYEKMSFTYEKREDVEGGFKRLSSIKIENGGTGGFCKEFKLSHNYFDNGGTSADDKRLRLDGLQEISCDGNDVIPPYTFEYFNDEPLPNRLSTAMDHWGFYNGVDAENRGALVPGDVDMGYFIKSNAMQPLSTKETNTIADIYAGFNACDVTPILPGDFPDVFTKLLPANLSSLIGLTLDNSQFTFSPTVASTDPRAPNFEFMRLGTLKLITYPYGGKSEFEYEANEHSKDNTNTIVGGLRIKSITLAPEKNATEATYAIVKQYSYTEDDDATSSGILYHMPTYDVVWGELLSTNKPQCSSYGTGGYELLFGKKVIPIRMRAAENIVPLSDYEGVQIGYGRVIENIAGENRVLEFETEVIDGDTPFNKGDSFSSLDSFVGAEIPFPPAPAQARVNAGTLLKESVSNADGTVVSEIEYKIKAADTYTESNEIFAKVYKTDIASIGVNDVLKPLLAVLEAEIQKVVRNFEFPNFGSLKVSNHLTNSYKIRSKPHRISSRSATLDGVTTLTKYTHSNTNVDNLLQTETGIDANNDGEFARFTETMITKFKYGLDNSTDTDLTAQYKARNMTGFLVETETSIENQLVSGTKTDFILIKNASVPDEEERIVAEKIWAVQGNNFVLQKINTNWNVHGYPEKYKRAKAGATNASKDTDELAYDQNYFEIDYDDYGFLPEISYWRKSEGSTLQKTTNTYYNNSNILKTHTNQNGIKTTYNYDNLLRPTKIVSNSGEVTTDFKYEYRFFTGNSLGNAVHENITYADEDTDQGAKSHKTLTYTDGLGRTTEIYRAKGDTEEDRMQGITYNKAGLAHTHWNWNTEANTTYNYESVFLNRPLSIEAPEGTTSYTYSANATALTISTTTTTQSHGINHLNKTSITDIDGNQTDTFTDYRGNTVMEVGAAGSLNAETKYLYNNKNQLVNVFPPLKDDSADKPVQGKIYKYTFNERGLLQTKQTPTSDLNFSYTYDELDRLQSTVDPSFHTTIYAYNEVDMLDKTGIGNAFTNRTTIKKGKELSEFTYKKNADGYKTWLNTEAYRILDGSGTMETTTYKKYDKVGRPTEYIKKGVFGNKEDTYYLGYNNLGQLTGKTAYLKTPTGDAPIQNWTYEYDEYNRLKETGYDNKTLFANRYHTQNNRLLSKYLQPVMPTNNNETGTCLQAIDYIYNDPAKRLTGINSINGIGKRNTANNQPPLQCKIAFELPIEQNGQGYVIEDLYFNNAHAKTESLQQLSNMNFPYYITENNDAGFISDLKAAMHSKGYIFNDVYLQFNEQFTLNFEQTNFIAQTIIHNKKSVDANMQNCCFEGNTGGVSIAHHTQNEEESGKLNSCTVPEITGIDRYNNKPKVKFKAGNDAQKVTLQYKRVDRSTWENVTPVNNAATLPHLDICYNYQVRIKAECNQATTFSATHYFKSYGCTDKDCSFNNFQVKVNNINNTQAVITFNEILGATYTVFYQLANGGTEKKINTTQPTASIVGLLPGREYKFFINANCGSKNTSSKYFYFTAQADPLLQLVPGNDLFAQELSYGGSNIYINNWQTLKYAKQTRPIHKYQFEFDDLNRVTKGYMKTAVFPNYLVNYSYDLRGNIKSLDRSSEGEFMIDDLVYTYDDNLDRLTGITENSKLDRGFIIKDRNGTNFNTKKTADYSYFSDGSLKTEQNKLLRYEYNHLNMPNKIVQLREDQKDSKNFIEIVYLSNGEKLSMHTFKNNVEVNTVYYRDNIEIRNNDVIVNHSNGRIVYENGSGDGEYQYYLKDHLGNVRLTFAKCSEVQLAMCKNDDITVINENHYYPFGMKMEGDWNSNNIAEPEVTNQYNGKEWVDDLGLAMNDYGARWYDPATARWNSVDPLAEKYVGHSPYNYVLGNPIKYIDPDGRDIELIIGKGYTDDNGKEHPYGHVALRVFNKELGYDVVFDFGRYGKTTGGIWGILPDGSNPSGEGILHIYKDGNIYLSSQQSYRNSIGFSKETSPQEDQAILDYFSVVISEGEKQDQSNSKATVRDRYKLKEDYWIKGPNCCTVSQDGLNQIDLNLIGGEYDPRTALKLLEGSYKTKDLKRTKYPKGGGANTTYFPKRDKNPQPIHIGGGNYITPN